MRLMGGFTRHMFGRVCSELLARGDVSRLGHQSELPHICLEEAPHPHAAGVAFGLPLVPPTSRRASVGLMQGKQAMQDPQQN